MRVIESFLLSATEETVIVLDEGLYGVVRGDHNTLAWGVRRYVAEFQKWAELELALASIPDAVEGAIVQLDGRRIEYSFYDDDDELEFHWNLIKELGGNHVTH